MPTYKAIIEEHLTKYHKPPSKPFSLLLINTNLNDGLGDFLHNYDFYKYLCKRFAGDNRVVVSGLCFITKNKLDVVNRIYKEDFATHPIVQITSPIKQDIELGSFVLCDQEYSGELDYATDANAVINISVLLQRDNTSKSRFSNIVIDYIESKIGTRNQPQFFSLLEYGSMHEGCISTVCGEEITEYAMGVRSYQAGIKFIPTLLEANAEKAAIQIKEQNNTVLQQFLLDHHDNTFVGFGYLQSAEHTLKFALAAARIAQKDNINLYINHQFFKNNNTYEPANQTLNDLIDNLKKITRISQIEFLSNAGECLHCISLDTDTKTQHDTLRVLRLINFPGTTETDKMHILALSDMVGASGDTSMSEMISSRKFPFFAVPPFHKLDFVYQIIGDLRYKFPEFKECIQYIEQGLPGGTYDYYPYLDFARNNAKIIGEQWAEYCQYLAEHCNVENTIDHLFEEAVIHEMAIIGSDEEKTAIIPIQQSISTKKISDRKLFAIIRCDEDRKFSEPKKKIIFQQKVADWGLENGVFPIVELAMGSLPTLMNQRRSFEELTDTPFFIDGLDKLTPLLLNAVDSYSIKKLTDRYTSWLQPLSNDIKFAILILDKLYNIACSSSPQQGIGLFSATQMVAYNNDCRLLCKATLLAFLALRVGRPDILCKSKEWQSAAIIAEKYPSFQDVISEIAGHDKFRCVFESLKFSL